MRASRSRGTPSAQATKKTTVNRPGAKGPRPPSAARPTETPAGSPRPRRGRPPGPGLTDEVWNIIVTYIRAGCYDYVAAETARISVRTFHDWIARGEGRSPRRSSARHRAFAADVAQARAQARLSAETRVHQNHPANWLTHAARSKPGREGWTEPVPDGAGAGWDLPAALEHASTDELESAIAAIDKAVAHQRSLLQAAETEEKETS